MTFNYININTRSVHDITYVENSFFNGAGESGNIPVTASRTARGWTIAVESDRSNQDAVAQSFNNRVPFIQNVWGTGSDSEQPAQLNFCFEVDVVISLISGSTQTVRLVMGQGHHSGTINDWWLAGFCLANDGKGNVQLICNNPVGDIIEVFSLKKDETAYTISLESWFRAAAETGNQEAKAFTASAEELLQKVDQNRLSISNACIKDITYIDGTLVITGNPSPAPAVEITPPQGEGSWRIVLNTNRQGSKSTAVKFVEKIGSANNIFGPDSGSRSPDVLNFFFGLSINFQYGAYGFCQDVYFAQGHSNQNDWWIGGKGIARQATASHAMLVLSLNNGNVCYTLGIKASDLWKFTFKESRNNYAPPRANVDWLSTLKGDTYINRISLPGTHDSAAITSYPYPWSQQNLSITGQFNTGIRLFDIRIAVQRDEYDNYTFYTCHGKDGPDVFNNYAPLIDVLAELNTCLSVNKNEFIVIIFKVDNDNNIPQSDYAGPLRCLINSALPVYPSRDLPQLSAVRGKAYIISRISQLNLGINFDFPENADEWCTAKDATLRAFVQDKYKTPVSNKLYLYKKTAMLQKDNPGDIIINFASAVSVDYDYLGFCVYIESDIMQWLASMSVAERMALFPGWSLHDFPNTNYGTDVYSYMSITDLIIQSNFSYDKYALPFSVYSVWGDRDYQ